MWELIAYDQWRAGQVGAASKSLATAEKYAQGDAKRRIQLDKAALTLDKGDLGTLEGDGTGNPPRAPSTSASSTIERIVQGRVRRVGTCEGKGRPIA